MLIGIYEPPTVIPVAVGLVFILLATVSRFVSQHRAADLKSDAVQGRRGGRPTIVLALLVGVGLALLIGGLLGQFYIAGMTRWIATALVLTPVA